MTNEHKSPPFRADHVGSLRRPESLIEAREKLLGPHDLDHNFGPHDNSALRRIEDEAIRDVVALQESTGIKSITDGEFRRRIWWSEFLLSLDGVEGNYRGPDLVRDATGHTMPIPRITITDKVRWAGSVNAASFKFLKSVTTETPKVTMPAPQTLYYFTSRAFISEQAYPDLAELWSDLADAYSAEIMALAREGCTYLQLDEVVTCCLCDETNRAMLRERGDDPDALLDNYINTINRIVAKRPPGMKIVMHTCRGNLQGHWFAEGGYDPIAERVFNDIDVDGFFLEYDSPRAGNFEPLRFVPDDKIVVLGLVSTKTPALEDRAMLKARIDEATQFLPLEQLGLSPQCGFSSNYLGNPVTIDDERRKLELIVQLADEIWT